MPSSTTSGDLGVALGSWRVSSGGTSHRPVVPITPRRTWPATSSRMEATSAASASSSAWTRRARATTAAPSSVSRRRPVDQRDAQLPLQAGDVGRDVGLHGVERVGGGREGPVSATATRAASCRRSIATNDGTASLTTVGQISWGRQNDPQHRTVDPGIPPPQVPSVNERAAGPPPPASPRPVLGSVPRWLLVRPCGAPTPTRTYKPKWGGLLGELLADDVEGTAGPEPVDVLGRSVWVPTKSTVVPSGLVDPARARARRGRGRPGRATEIRSSSLDLRRRSRGRRR